MKGLRGLFRVISLLSTELLTNKNVPRSFVFFFFLSKAFQGFHKALNVCL